LVQELAKDNKITVITPQRFHKLTLKKGIGYGKERCQIIRPVYFSFSDRSILGFKTFFFTEMMYKKSVVESLKRLKEKPDVIYTHFFKNARPVLDYSEKNKIPLVVASGESTYDYWFKIPKDIHKKMFTQINHIICVSQGNKEKLVELGFDENKMTVVPNAVDYSLFRPLNKKSCKERLGLSTTKFTIGFIGHFIHRKGPNRIIKAIEMLGDENIELVCVGNRGELLKNSFTTVLNPRPNYQLPEIYNAFDVFVLPTLNEGHCNVIEEAKACAIPIISSKGTTVEGQIDSEVGILVDPLKVDEIAESIALLKSDNKLRDLMSYNLKKRAGDYGIEQRARKINEILSEFV